MKVVVPAEIPWPSAPLPCYSSAGEELGRAMLYTPPGAVQAGEGGGHRGGLPFCFGVRR